MPAQQKPQGVTEAARAPIATAYAEPNRPVVLCDLEDFDRFRTAVSAVDTSQPPLIVTFEARRRAVYLGLAGDLGFVQVTPVPDQPPYIVTVGESERDVMVEFFLHGWHHTEIKARHLVAAEHAWSAVREFLESGRLLSSLRWGKV